VEDDADDPSLLHGTSETVPSEAATHTTGIKIMGLCVCLLLLDSQSIEREATHCFVSAEPPTTAAVFIITV